MKKTTRLISILTIIAMMAAVFAVLPFSVSAAEVFAVSFDANGGTGDMTPASVNSGDMYTLPDNEFTAPTGKEFDKWEVEGSTYAPAEQITVTAAVTVKATWKDIVYATAAELQAAIDQITDLTADLTAAEGRLDALDTDIADVQAQLGTVNTTLTNLANKDTELAGDIADIQTALGTVNTTLTNLANKDTELAGDIADIQTALGTVNTILTNLANKDTELAGDIADIQTALGTVNTTLTNLANKDTELKGEIDTLNAALTNAKNDLNTRIDGVIADLNSAKTALEA